MLVVFDYPCVSTYGLSSTQDISSPKPWFFANYFPTSTESLPTISSLKRTIDPLQHYKKTTEENKNSKKSILPYFAADPPIAHDCKELKKTDEKSFNAMDNPNVICYSCKDPINNLSNYHYCTYASKPIDSRSDDDNFQVSASNGRTQKSIKEPNRENCKKTLKGNMLCTTCKDPITNGNYEQCSYQPNHQSITFGEPKKTREQIVKDARSRSTEKLKLVKEDDAEEGIGHLHYQHEPEEDNRDSNTHDVPDYSYHKEAKNNNENDEEPRASSNDCKIVRKNGQSCRVCKNPKTGDQSENCRYSMEPKNKGYRYSNAKSFGYPNENNDDDDENEESEYKGNASSEDDDYSPYAEENNNDDNDDEEKEGEELSESERISEKTRKEGDCEEVERDGMLCTICKDPKSGGDSERCNYSYDPEDTIFAYTNSKSFGNPAENYGDDDDYYLKDYSSGSGSEEQPEESFDAPAVLAVRQPKKTSSIGYVPKNMANKNKRPKKVCK